MAAPPVQRPAAAPGWMAMPAPRASAWHPAFYLVIVYMIFTYTRFAEIFAIVTHKGARLALIINLLAVPVILLSGGLLQALRSRVVLSMTVFTAWFCLAIPFSVWRGGSVYQLINWLLALVSLFLLAGCIDGFEQCSQAMYALAISVLVISGLGFFLEGSAIKAEGRFTLEQGTFANPNDLATLLLMGLPGCLLVLRRRRGISVLKLACWGALFLIPVTVVRTGSRGGLLALIIMFVMYWISVPALRKLQVGLGAVVVIAASLVFSNTDALERYKTIFVSTNQRAYETTAQESAVESAMSRKELFLRSVRMSLDHPLLGVGPGQFQNADAKNSSEDNLYTYWRETHNTFTQISSEEGIPGLLFYGAAIFFCFRTTRAARKLARQDEGKRWVGDLGFTLRLSLVAFVITGMFASNAYYFYFPFVAGLCGALERALAAEKKLFVTTDLTTDGRG